MEDFQQWLKDFVKKHGGYQPRYIDYWFKKVAKTHENIRKLLGGSRVQKFYSIDCQQKGANQELIKGLVDNLLEIYPDYLRQYNYTRDVFNFPTIPIGSHQVTKTAKHFRSAALNWLSSKYLSSDKVYGESVKTIDNCLSKIGEIWAKARTNKAELEITISTTPKAFALLGHYGPDLDSCFKQNGSSGMDKFVLGQTYDTFVLTIARKAGDKYTNVARCFGFVSHENTVFNLSNYYFSSGFQEGDALEVIRTFLSEITNKKMDLSTNNTVIGGGIFRNPYGAWVFTENGKKVEVYVLQPDTNHIKKGICDSCSSSDDGQYEVDDVIVCYSCRQKANTCEISGKLTFKGLEKCMTPDGIEGMGHPDIVKEYDECSKCHIKSWKLIRTTDAKMLCADCCDEISTCDECGNDFDVDSLTSTDDGDLCKECFSIHESNIDEDEDTIEDNSDEVVSPDTDEVYNVQG